MGALDMSGTMDALAAAIPDGATMRKHPYPMDAVEPPCAVVGYPTSIQFDMTFGRGADEATFPVWFFVGVASTLAARDACSDVLAGAKDIKAALEAATGPFSSVHVTEAEVEGQKVGDITYLSVRFDCEVIS